MPKSKIKLRYDAIVPRVENTRESKLFVIATEGEKREPDYFDKFGSTNIKLIILKGDEGFSAPSQLIEKLDKYRKDPNKDFGDGDECWIVFDMDHHDEVYLTDILKASEEGEFKIAVSNPCFEYWLFLHRFDTRDLPSTVCAEEVLQRPREMKKALDETLAGYDFKKLHFREFREDVEQAVRKAKNQRNRSRPSCPDCPGTDVWKLVEKLPINF